MQLIDNYAGGQALVVRIHHCIADGIALIGVLLALTTDQNDGASNTAIETSSFEWQRKLERAAATADVRRGEGDRNDAATSQPGCCEATARCLIRRALYSMLRLDTRGIAARVAKDTAAIALMRSDSATSLKGKPSGVKVVAWNEPIAVDDVKAIGKALGCSINDVLLACVAGAIRSYLMAPR